MKITSVESFNIEIPITAEQEELRYYNKTGVTRIRTDEGITGYGWSSVDPDAARQMLVGRDPLQVEQLVAKGLGHDFYGAENALWDIVGKAFEQPLHKLWGNCRDEMRLYLTTVWPVDVHQTQVSPEQQAIDIEHYASLGYDAFKIRIWRPDLIDDVEGLTRKVVVVDLERLVFAASDRDVGLGSQAGVSFDVTSNKRFF